jgi:hypothetical protein
MKVDHLHASSADHMLTGTVQLSACAHAGELHMNMLRGAEAPAGALGGADKDGGGRGQTQRAGTGDHQHIARQLRRQQHRCRSAACHGTMSCYHLHAGRVPVSFYFLNQKTPALCLS